MTSFLLGELAALSSSLCFTFGPTLFTIAGRQLGSLTTNRMRLLLGVAYFLVIHWIIFGTPYPHMATRPLIYMLLSGVVGLALSDVFLFEAFLLVGPRIALLIINLAPVLATAMAWVLLDERLSLPQLAAIAVVLSGVSWVVLERGAADEEGKRERHYAPRGLLYALIAAVVGAFGVLFAKMGMNANINPISGATVRLSGGMAVLWLWTILAGDLMPTLQKVRANPKALRMVAIAVLVGPVIGVSLSLYALKTIPVGIATTLASLPPVLLLPVSHWVFHERITPRAIIGTVIATAGVVWLLTL